MHRAKNDLPTATNAVAHICVISAAAAKIARANEWWRGENGKLFQPKNLARPSARFPKFAIRTSDEALVMRS